ncbi:MAG: hypothetical protein ABSG31_16805 [Tepidisphaeraceae bacterium]
MAESRSHPSPQAGTPHFVSQQNAASNVVGPAKCLRSAMAVP